jgi:hypothetical protein
MPADCDLRVNSRERRCEQCDGVVAIMVRADGGAAA